MRGRPRGSTRLAIGHKSNRMVLNEAAIRLGVSLRQTEDELCRNMLAATAGFINCVGGVNGDNPTEITQNDVSVVTRTLLGNNANTIMDSISAEDMFGTGPIRNAFFSMSHVDMTTGLEQIAGFLHQSQYPSPMNILKLEWSAVAYVRFLISSIGSTIAAGSFLGATVYNNFVAGMESYAIVEQDGYSAQFIYRPAIYNGPLALNVTAGFKMAQVPRLLNDQWLINLRATL